MQDVKERREALGWSKERLAAKANVSLRTIVNVEAGTRVPLPITQESIERALAQGEREQARKRAPS